MNQTLYTAAALIIPLIIAIVFHEVAHGWVARALGDKTAEEQHRLTLNPLRHVDPIGTIVVPGMLALLKAPVFGWAKPVPVNQARLRNPRYGMMAVAAAGPATNFALAAIGAVLLGLLARGAGNDASAIAVFVGTSLNYFITLNLFLAMFNLLPLPPFDGSHIVEGLLPRRAARQYQKLRPYGFPLLFLLLLVVPWLFPQAGIIENIVFPPVAWMGNHYFALAEAIARH